MGAEGNKRELSCVQSWSCRGLGFTVRKSLEGHEPRPYVWKGLSGCCVKNRLWVGKGVKAGTQVRRLLPPGER